MAFQNEVTNFNLCSEFNETINKVRDIIASKEVLVHFDPS